jgi:hypothetical protein
VKPSLPTVLTTAAALLAHDPADGSEARLAGDLPFVRMVLIVAAREYEQCAARRECLYETAKSHAATLSSR